MGERGDCRGGRGRRGRRIRRGKQGKDANRDNIAVLVVSGAQEVDFELLELE